MNWPMVHLESVADIVRGVTFSKAEAADECANGMLPVLRAGNIQDTLETEHDLLYVDTSKISEAQKLRSHDIVMCMSSGSARVLGKSAMIGSDWNGSFGAFLATIRSHHDRLDPNFIAQYFRSREFRGWASSSSGIGIKNIRASDLKSYKIPLPPLEEQKRIAGILDQADALRRLRTRALDKLNILGQVIFHEMFGETSKTSNGKVLLGDLLTFVTSGGRGWAKYYSDEGQRFIRSLDVQMNAIGDDEVVFVNPPDNAEAKRTRVETGDVLMTITGSKIGRVAPVVKELDGAYVSQHVAILRPAQNQLTPEFLSFFLSMEQFGQKQIKSKQYGQAKPGLNFQQIRSFELPKVPIEDQQSFVRRLHEINIAERDQTAAACANDILFASLQHRAFRGEL